MSYRQLREPNPHPSAIYSGNTLVSNWAGWCLAYVQIAFGTPRMYPKAWAAWQATTRKHTNRTFPRNVAFPVWFEHWGTYNGIYDNWGHVAICKVAGNGTKTIWSSPASNKAAPDTYSTIAQIEQVFSSKYVGWSEDLSNTQLIQQEDTQVTKLTLVEDFRNCFMTQARRKANKAEEEAWQKSGMEAYDWVYHHGHNPLKEEFARYRTNAEEEMRRLDHEVNATRIELEKAADQMVEQEAVWKTIETTYRVAAETAEAEANRKITLKDETIADLNKQLDIALQNAKEPSKWTATQHLRAALRAFLGGDD